MTKVKNCLIPGKTHLTLKFQGAEALLGCTDESDCQQPIPKEKIAVFHHCTTFKTGSKTTAFALKDVFRMKPVMITTLTFLADNAFFNPLGFKIFYARSFIGKSFIKL
jgi:hypothetical protein